MARPARIYQPRASPESIRSFMRRGIGEIIEWIAPSFSPRRFPRPERVTKGWVGRRTYYRAERREKRIDVPRATLSLLLSLFFFLFVRVYGAN